MEMSNVETEVTRLDIELRNLQKYCREIEHGMNGLIRQLNSQVELIDAIRLAANRMTMMTVLVRQAALDDEEELINA
jgi:hypothetical protein